MSLSRIFRICSSKLVRSISKALLTFFCGGVDALELKVGVPDETPSCGC